VHGGIANEARVHVRFIETTGRDLESKLADVGGILVPGGFGDRGIEGKIQVARLAREGGIPYFGLCLGMQVAVIEFARNVLKLAGAHSTSSTRAPPPRSSTCSGAEGGQSPGRLHAPGRPTRVRPVKKGSLAHRAYGAAAVRERHRHRYEVNNRFRKRLEGRRVRVSGTYAAKNLVEIVELRDHPWFLAVQFHPEFKSRPEFPHPLSGIRGRGPGPDRPASPWPLNRVRRVRKWRGGLQQRRHPLRFHRWPLRLESEAMSGG